tara:strand:- start:38 stop:526 length:489 start_codon:yes stop_codon:yes gene_type:complete
MHHRTVKLDRIAVQLSGLCLLHCLALPLVIAVVPVLGLAEHGHAFFHQLMLLVVVPVAMISLGRGYIVHRRARVAFFGVLGVALLATAALLVHPHAHIGPTVTAETAERWITVAGALILAAAHTFNARAMRDKRRAHRRCLHAPATSSADPGVRAAGSIRPQ